MMVHDELWYYFQRYTAIPMMICVVYKMIRGPWNLNKCFFEETLSSHQEALRFWSIKKCEINKSTQLKRLEKDPSLRRLTPNFVDTIILIYLTLCTVYYYYDCYYKVVIIGFINFSSCTWYYFIHHVLTIYYYKHFAMIPYYNWYHIFVPCFHAALIGFPNLWLGNLIYGIGIGCFIFQFLFKNSWSTLNQKYVLSSAYTIPICNILMVVDNCIK